MNRIYTYKDNEIYCHHTIDEIPDPGDFPIHAHDQMEIFCFLSGKGYYLVEGTSYELHPGDIMIMRQAETHKLIIAPSSPYERIAVHFYPKLISDIDKRLLDPFLNRPLGTGNLFPAREYPELVNAFTDFNFRQSAMERTHILSRLLRFLSDLYDIKKEDSFPESPRDYFSSMVFYVNEHIFEKISTQSLSALFSKSPSQIRRDFSKATGTTFWKYVSLKRLLSARALLERGESAQNAAYLCGFSDYSSFFRAYKKYFGHSPSISK